MEYTYRIFQKRIDVLDLKCQANFGLTKFSRKIRCNDDICSETVDTN